MKRMFTSALLVLITVAAHSQAVKKNKLNFGAGLSLAIPVYNLDISSVGGGIDILLLYGLTHNISLTADAGFTGLPGKGVYPSTAIIPVRLGARYFPLPKLYLGAKAGLGIYTILKASASHTAYSLNTGYFLTKKMDASIFYDGFTNKNSSFGYTGFRLGYQF